MFEKNNERTTDTIFHVCHRAKRERETNTESEGNITYSVFLGLKIQKKKIKNCLIIGILAWALKQGNITRYVNFNPVRIGFDLDLID